MIRSLVIIFALAIQISSSQSVTFTVTETSINVQWIVDDVTAIYNLKYNPYGDITSIQTISVSMPSQNNVEIIQPITSLLPGHLYDVELLRNGTQVFKQSVSTKPLPVENLHSNDITDTTMNITWSTMVGSQQDTFIVLVGGVTDMSFNLTSGNLSSTWFLLTGLHHSQEYDVSVLAYSYGEPSNSSVSFITNTAPLPPIQITVVAIDTEKLNISWTPNTISSQDSYRIGYHYNSSEGNELVVNVTCSSTHQNFCIVTMPGAPGQLYDVTVYALYNGVPSIGLTTSHTTTPLPITDLEEFPQGGSMIGLKWKHPVNSFFNKLIMLIKSVAGEMTMEFRPEIVNMSISLQAGMMYNVTVYVITNYENSTGVQKVFFTKPKEVTDLRISVETESAMAVWTFDQSTLANLFIIDIVPAPENWTYPVSLPSDAFNYTFTDIIPGTSYTVYVKTRLSFKESDPVTQVFTTFPNKPESVTVNVISGSEVKVTWQAPSGLVDRYSLTLTEVLNGNSQSTAVTGTFYTYYSLKSGTQYSLKMESESAGKSSQSVVKNFVTNPQAVSGFKVTTEDNQSLRLSWAPPSTDFEYYELIISPADAKSPVNISRESGTLQYIFRPLRSGQLYTVSIQTFSHSMASAIVSDRAITSPRAVQSMTVIAVGNGLEISWEANVESQQSGFIVSYKELPSGPIKQLPEVVATENKYQYSVSITDLYAGGTYEILIQAWQNISGESAPSLRRGMNGTTKPSPIGDLSAITKGSYTIELDWVLPLMSRWDHFVVRHRPSLRDPNAIWIENSTYSTNLTLTHLFPGESYDIEVFTVNKEISSDVTTTIAITVPLAPTDLSIDIDNTTENSVTIQWNYNTDTTFSESWIVSYTDTTGNMVNKTVPVIGTLVTVTVDRLVAGFKYTFIVISKVGDVTSEEVSIVASTVPANNIILSFTKTPTNESFFIDYIIPGADNFDQVVFRLVSLSQEVVRTRSNPLRSIEFSTLESGALYLVEVQTVFGSIRSKKNNITAQTLPNAPLVSGSATSTEIVLTITQPSGGIDQFSVICYNARNLVVKDTTLTPTAGDAMLSIDQLEPYMEYRCDVSAVFHDFSSTTRITLETKESAPSVVRNLIAVESAPLQVTLTWATPVNQNGAITTYVINFIGRKEATQVEGGRNVSFPSELAIFDDLKAGYTYTFYVRAQTVDVSEPASIEIALKTYKPQYRDGIDDTQATPKTTNINPQQIAVNFSNAFSDKYGEIIQFTVIVTEDKDSPNIQNNHFLPGWKTARNDPNIKAYQVMSNCSTFFNEGSTCDGTFKIEKRSVSTVEYKVFTIGTESNCENRYYCNGPLKPETTYFVTLRAYTTMQYQDTPFTDAIRTARIGTDDEGNNAGIIAGIIIPIVVVIILVVVIVVFLRRRMASKSNMYRHQPEAQVQYRASLTKRKSCCPVSVSEFREHVYRMKADSDFRYAEQFEDLKEVGRGQPCTFAELPCNRGKNRFTNILPYDHSRVKLSPIDDEEGSDYINANYIPGFRSKREYIVCQGPLPATRDEFWRMIWEQNCRNIVMLTKCMEKGREKCDKYWPSGADSLFYGDLQVVALNETVFPDWIMTEFKISLGDQSRQIRHFHFTSWPDFGVPKKEQVLVRFVRMVREKLIKDGGPVVVHCSAGVGRSGTFVVLDRLLQEIKTKSTVDIFSMVAELRRERVWMVQTEQQYICIHNCILCVLEGREDEHVYDNVGHSNVAFEDDEGVDLT